MRPALPSMPAMFARIHGCPESRPVQRERSAPPTKRSLPPRGISTTETDPWMYDWLATGSEW